MKFKTISMLLLAGLLASCGNDEPTPRIDDDDVIQVKEEANRTVLIGTENGKLYNMKDGSIYKELPSCEWVNDMTMHGENYYVAGYGTQRGSTYWVNGEAVSLGNDRYETYDVARSFDNVYVLGEGDAGTCVYRNGTKIAETQDAFSLVALAANGNTFYAVGDYSPNSAALWTNNGLTQLDAGGQAAHATEIDLVTSNNSVMHYISGYRVTTTGGSQVTSPCLWHNATLSSLPLNFTESEKNRNTYRSGQANDVAHSGQKIFVAGHRSDGNISRATVWITSTYDDDDVKTYWQPDGNIDAVAKRVLVYGSDIYVMTVEHNRDTDAWCTRIWMNHELKGTVNGIIGNGFVVI